MVPPQFIFNYKKTSVRGNGLIELIITIVALGVVGSAATYLVNNVLKNLANQQFHGEFAAIIRRVEAVARTQENIGDAAQDPANIALLRCITDSGTTNTKDCDVSLGAQSLKLIRDGATVARGPNMTGEPSWPSSYTATGVQCTKSDVTCPIRASAWFEPYCGQNRTSCDKAESVKITYEVAIPDGLLTGAAIQKRLLALTKKNAFRGFFIFQTADFSVSNTLEAPFAMCLSCGGRYPTAAGGFTYAGSNTKTGYDVNCSGTGNVTLPTNSFFYLCSKK